MWPPKFPMHMPSTQPQEPFLAGNKHCLGSSRHTSWSSSVHLNIWGWWRRRWTTLSKRDSLADTFCTKYIYEQRCKESISQDLPTCRTEGLHACYAWRRCCVLVVRYCLPNRSTRELLQLHRGKSHRHPGMLKGFRTWLEQLHASARRKHLRPTNLAHAVETLSPFPKAPEGHHTGYATRKRAETRQAKSSADTLGKLSVKLEVYQNNL